MWTPVYPGTASAPVIIMVWGHWSDVYLPNHSVASMEDLDGFQENISEKREDNYCFKIILPFLSNL